MFYEFCRFSFALLLLAVGPLIATILALAPRGLCESNSNPNQLFRCKFITRPYLSCVTHARVMIPVSAEIQRECLKIHLTWYFRGFSVDFPCRIHRGTAGSPS